MGRTQGNLLRGALELLILKALSSGPRHGYGVLEWIERETEGVLMVEEGTLYPALHRFESKGLLESRWGVSENRRQAKFYSLTELGRARLEAGIAEWNAHQVAIHKALGSDAGA